MKGSFSDDVRGSPLARERARSRRALQSLLNWCAEADARPTEADLAEVPAEFRAIVLEEVDELRKMYRAGDRGRARQRAHEAAILLVATYGPGAESTRLDPRSEADAVRGLSAVVTDGDPPLSGGGDPTGPTEEMDPRKLAKQIAEGRDR